MRKTIHRVVCFLGVVLVIASCLPFSAFAVDPVSAGVVANAFAQAIAAYGASNGVAMTFDVSNTNGIGETVHELWTDFRNGTQDADDYDTLAAALFPDLYYKALSVGAGAAEVYTVGYNISSTYAEEFDKFYNWLLSGPAEMTKVDNQYFQFASAQVGPNAQPIVVSSVYGVPELPRATWGMTQLQLYNSGLIGYNNTSNGVSYSFFSFDNDAWIVAYLSGSTYSWLVVMDGVPSSGHYPYAIRKQGNDTSGSSPSYGSTPITGTDYRYASFYSVSSSNASYITVPLYSSLNDALAVFSNGLSADTLGVKAYSNTGVASFPDTTDPNYQATAKQIPSTYPWDNSLYGDGTGALSDAQAGAIAAEASGALVTDGILSIAGTTTADPGGGDDDDDDDETSDDPDDFAVVGLEDLFPFCIPFDIYNFLSSLAAEPVAPHFTVILAFPQALGGSQTIELDFDSPTWNQLAQLLRLLELLAFIVGLALLTRSMFIRG